VTEIIPRTAPNQTVELTKDGSAPIGSIDPITPQAAAFLARGILGCAAALSGANPPPVGTLVGDAHLPIMQWRTGRLNINGEPVLMLSIPPGIELTFQLPEITARALGKALLDEGDRSAPLGGQRGTVH